MIFHKMKLLLLTLFSFIYGFVPCTTQAQVNDFIVLKKNGRAITSLFSGSLTEFTTDKGYYAGRVEAIRHDSIFLVQYDVRQVPTHLGVYVLDTVAFYHLKFNYHEITYMGKKADKGFNWSGSGGSLFGGGILLTTIGLGTWIFTKPRTTYHAPASLIIGSAFLGGVGYMLMKKGSGYKIGGKYSLEYIGTK